MIIWITGLPGSGKTTLAKNLKSILETKVSNNIVLLDGDNIRNLLPYKMSYSNEDRMKLAFFYSCIYKCFLTIVIKCFFFLLINLNHF